MCNTHSHLSYPVSLSRIPIILFLTLAALLYSFIIWRYPYQEGGDALFHTWFTEQILVTGAIPLSAPTYNITTAYSFTPIYHVISASLSMATGLPVWVIVPAMGVITVVLFLLLIYCIARTIFHSQLVALFSALSATVLLQELYGFLPRNLAFLFALAATLFFVQFIRNRVSIMAGTLIYTTLLATTLTHFLVAAYMISFLVATCIVLFFVMPSARKRLALFLVLTTVVIATWFLLSAPLLSSVGIPINATAFVERSMEVSALSSTPRSLPLPHFLHFPLVLLVFTGSAVLLFYHRLRGQLLGKVLIMVWTISGLLFLYQYIAGYNFFSDRAELMSLPSVAIIIGTSILFITRQMLPMTAVRTFMIALVVLFSVMTLSQSTVLPVIPWSSAGIPREHIVELDRLRRTVPHGIVLSDPGTMYLLTTLAGMRAAYQYEHTNLVRNMFIHWPEVQQTFFEGPIRTRQMMIETGANYLVVAARTRRYFNDVDFTFLNEQETFKKIYTSPIYDPITLGNDAQTFPYYSVYVLLDQQK